ncbi:hypothetical protein EIP91_001861 [Steccherinum ochraceum]|uniref:Cytochrome P450 67 n=1 Tax=Steccherinum ochraceum TaxID=92696 RepID=A0A4R0RGY7_9APHY|nr:hypothetical protein EIP91_001861 [Steccherinum ochraceum]
MVNFAENSPCFTCTFSVRDICAIIAGFALITHAVFNRFEPLNPFIVVPLLLLLPLTMSLLFLHHFTLLYAATLAFMIFHSTLLCSIGTYRLSPFHPLAHYSGPVLNKLSSWWLYKITTGGKRYEFIQRLHRHYKSHVVRIGPNEISISDPAAVVSLLGPNGLSKGPAWDGHVRYSPIRPLIALRDSHPHSKARRPWTRAFSAVAMKEYEPTLAERVVQLVDLAMSSHGTGQTVDMARLFRLFSYDFMNDMAFGGGMDLMRNGDTQGMVSLMDRALEALAISESIPWLTRYVPNVSHSFQSESALRAQARVRSGPTAGKKDVFYYLSNEDEAEERSPDPISVAIQAFLVIVAGSDTTFSTLKVDKYYPPGESALNSTFHAEMSYLDAVVNETLRLYPILPSGGQRATKEQGVQVNSIYIPPYTSVRIHQWTMLRDPCNFSPHSESFWPERWLIAQDPSSFKAEFIHNADAFHPFSYGPANCAGRALAIKELKMVLCHMLQQIDVAFADGYDPAEWEKNLRDPFTLQTGPLPVLVTARDR